MNVTQAAQRIGAKKSEVLSVDDSEAGVIIHHADGSLLVIVPDDQPDADGKTGIMFLVAPSDNYQGVFPVYAQPQYDDEDPDTVVVVVDDDDDDDEDPGTGVEPVRTGEVVVPPPDLNAKELVKWVREVDGADRLARATATLEAERATPKPRGSLTAPLERIIAELTEAGIGQAPSAEGDGQPGLDPAGGDPAHVPGDPTAASNIEGNE